MVDNKQECINIILAHELVDSVINEAIENWTQRSFQEPDKKVKRMLTDYATAITQKILNAPTPFPDFSVTWRKKVFDVIFDILDYEKFKKQQVFIIANALKEKFGDTTDDLENGLWGYSLVKIANTTGCVAYMVACNLDPNLLRLSDEEVDRHLLEMAQKLFQEDPNKVVVFDPNIDDPIDIVIRLQHVLQKDDDGN